MCLFFHSKDVGLYCLKLCASTVDFPQSDHLAFQKRRRRVIILMVAKGNLTVLILCNTHVVYSKLNFIFAFSVITYRPICSGGDIFANLPLRAWTQPLVARSWCSCRPTCTAAAAIAKKAKTRFHIVSRHYTAQSKVSVFYTLDCRVTKRVWYFLDFLLRNWASTIII